MSKEIICADALPWLSEHRNVGAVVTSLPDQNEIPNLTDEAWQRWFVDGARHCLLSTSPSAPTIFYQTDRKRDGVLISKAFLLLKAAELEGHSLLWHKIVLRRAVGKVDMFRPGFTHLMAFSRSGRSGSVLPDVLDRGQMVYPNAMGLDAARFALEFARSRSTRLLDPFCGRGTVPTLADFLGMEATGVDIDPEQCRHARELQFTETPA